MLTIDEINRLYKEDWEAARSEYGAGKIPWEVQQHICERQRARYVMHTVALDSGTTMLAHMKRYAIWGNVIKEMLGVDEISTPRRETLNEKHNKMVAWCLENVGRQITPDDLAEQSGFSRSKCLQFMKDNVGMFHPLKRGLYELRDPKVEKEREKRELDK